MSFGLRQHDGYQKVNVSAVLSEEKIYIVHRLQILKKISFTTGSRIHFWWLAEEMADLRSLEPLHILYRAETITNASW